MSEHIVSDIMDKAMKNLKTLTDANTIIGQPVIASNGITILPVSKVSFGFAAGGADIPSSTPKDKFGGGSSGGVTIQPIAFLVVNDNDVKILQVTTSNNTADRIVNTVPDVIDKIISMFPKKKETESGGIE